MKCPKCDKELQIQRHKRITEKILKQSYFFTEWGRCTSCGYMKMFEDKKVFIDIDKKYLTAKTKKAKKKVKKKLNKNKPKKRIKSKNYKKYINSKEWRERRKLYYSEHEKKCTVCGSKENIHLHHIIYANLGCEPDKDLNPLCKKDHFLYHKHYKNGSRKGITKP